MRVAWLLFGLCACSASLFGNADGTGGSNAGDDDGTGPDANGSNASGDGSGSSEQPLVGPYFTQPMFWNRDVSATAKAASSDAMIGALAAAGGFGAGGHMQIDFSIDVLATTSGTPMRSFTTTSDFYTPDCDHVQVPVPPNGDVEGETGYACTGDGDCHLIVHDAAAGKLYEMWRANITSPTTFAGGCLAVWTTTQSYADALRGDQCTSADAAGYPIAPLLFSADEVAAGHIDHAIRFILPNDRVRRGYVRPATHAGGTSAVCTAASGSVTE